MRDACAAAENCGIYRRIIKDTFNCMLNHRLVVGNYSPEKDRVSACFQEFLYGVT